MRVSLDDIPASVCEKVGVAVYIAQRLESALVCHLLVRRNQTASCITPEMIEAIEDELERMTLGQLVRALNIETGTDASAENTLTRALQYRNHIAHSFFKSFDSVEEPARRVVLMLNRLELMILEMRSAVGLMQHWTEALAFSLKVDIEAIRRDYDNRLSLLSLG